MFNYFFKINKKTKKEIIRKVITKSSGIVIGVCATKVTNDILDNICPEPASIAMKVMYGTGIFMIGDMVGELASDHMINKVESTAETITFIKQVVEILKTEESEEETQA